MMSKKIRRITMKRLLYGISMILMGIVGLLISWIGEMPTLDVIGVIFAIIGFVVATIGFFGKE